MMHAARNLILSVLLVLLSGCVESLISGASLFYDRHNVYKKMNDIQMAGLVNQSLYRDKRLRQEGCALDVAVFNGDVLLAGHLPSESLRELARERVMEAVEPRRVFLQVSLTPRKVSGLEDAWITAKVRSRIVGDSRINPHKVKVVTVDNIVYLMGDTLPVQASKVINIARNTSGVRRVVRLFKYYHLHDEPPQKKLS